MRAPDRRWFVGAIFSIALFAAMGLAQSDASRIQPLRKAPVVAFTVNPGFRDWSPATIAGTTILAGNQTGSGGLFAIDTLTGKVKWTYRTVFSTGTAGLSTPPAVTAELAIVPFAAAYPGAVVAVSLATGKEVWRGPDPVQNAAVAVSGDLAYILGKNGNFYALDAATGRERWKAVFATNLAPCASLPIVQEDTVYLTAIAAASPPGEPGGYYLFALDARTGKERWRYRAEAPYVHSGVCLSQPVVTADTIFATGEQHLYAVQRATGRDRWPAIEIRRSEDGRVDGQVRAVEVHGLVDAGAVVIGMTPGFLIAFDKSSGRTAWEIAGKYRESASNMAVAGNVLYFQGSPGAKPETRRALRCMRWIWTRTASYGPSRVPLRSRTGRSDRSIRSTADCG